MEGAGATETRFAVLHEFGHVLDLVHETQNPDARIPWDEPAVSAYLSGPPSRWTALERSNQGNLLTRIADRPGSYRPFDPQSIMWYTLPAQLFTKPINQRKHSELSASDKALARRLYPRTQ